MFFLKNFLAALRENGGKGTINPIYTSSASCMHKQDNRYSRVWNSISLVGGDYSDFTHYRTEVIALGLSMPSSSGGLAGYTPVVRGKGP